jgi:cell pole-organizing protein PopZ
MNEPQPGEPVADPSMEDILASIRRILNTDGETDSAPEGAPPASEAHASNDVFELDSSMIIDDGHEIAHEATASEPPAPEPEPHITHEPPAEEEPEPLLAPSAAAAASASMGALVRVLGQRHTQVYRGGPTLEDIVRDEIRPLVKNWLDENLAPMVERMVRTEIERVTSRNL